MTLPSESGVLEQELEEADEVVRAPPTLLIRLAETDRAMRRDAREEPVVEDVESDGRAGAEAAHGAVRQPRLERAALEPAKHALDDRERDASERGRRGACVAIVLPVELTRAPTPRRERRAACGGTARASR